MGFERKYDRAIMESEEGQRLYVHWKSKVIKNTDSREFETFHGFYNWSLEAGFTFGAQLHRLDPTLPFSPDNCVWITREKTNFDVDSEFEMRWNKTVNRIRKHYGMEPLRLTEEECHTEVENCG